MLILCVVFLDGNNKYHWRFVTILSAKRRLKYKNKNLFGKINDSLTFYT